MRVHFYIVKDELWFGEVTTYPGGSVAKMSKSFDSWLGALWMAASCDEVRELYPQISQFRIDN